MRKSLTLSILGIGLLALAASVRADIPFFWLDRPQNHPNPNDPNSPKYVAPYSGPTATPNQTATANAQATAGVPTNTALPTNTPTNSNTFTFTNTYTKTNTPSGPTNTPTNTATGPTNTPTNTNTPGGPTSTNTPTNTNTFTNTNTPTATNTPPPGSTVKFEDFETGALVGNYTYDDTGACSPAPCGTSSIGLVQGTTAFAGTGSAQYNVTTAGSSKYGAGGGMGSNYASPSPGDPVDATGAVKVQFYIKSDKNINFVVSIKEGNVATADPTNENWSSPAQNVPGDNAWHLVEIALSAFTENIYNPDCTGAPGGCAGSGNNTMDKNVLKAFDIQFNVLAATSAATVYLDDVYFSALPMSTNTPTVTPTYTPTPTATFTTGASCGLPCAGCIKYEDFEGAALVGGYTYADTANGASSSEALVTTEHSTCLQALEATINMGAGTYAAVGFGSNFYAPDVINAAGSTYMRLWMKSSQAVDFKVSFSEYRGTPATSADEGWTSPQQSYTATGSWQAFMIYIPNFTENIYNAACSPNCLTVGNNTPDLDVVGAIDINFVTAGFNGTVYIDDVAFDSTVPTATPTPGAQLSFNDFEDGLACGSYTYSDTFATMTQATDGAAAHTGAWGWRLTTDTTSPSFVWGCGGGTQPPGCAVQDMTGKSQVAFWARATGTGGPVNYTVTLSELNVPVSWPTLDPANEQWRPASTTPFPVDGTWHQYVLNLGSFTENMGNAACSAAPGCAAQGNNTLDLNVMTNFDINVTNSGFNGTIDIDDIVFQ